MKSKFIVIFLIAWSGVYKVDSCTFNNIRYTVNNSNPPCFTVDNIHFYKQ